MIITDKDIDEKTLREKDERTIEYFDQLADLQKKYDELNDFSNSQCAILLKENAILKAQIEKMKCCQNCKHHSFWGDELKCNFLSYDEESICLKDKNEWELS